MTETSLEWHPDQDMAEILISEADLNARIAELGAQITADYDGKRLLLLGVLKGAVVFLVDLARQIQLSLEIDFMAVSSYGASTKSSGIVRILKDLEESVEGQHILVVEDIIDSGLTLDYLLRSLEARGPASIRVCGLLVKDRPRDLSAPVEYVGFTIPDRFVVGYGLDFAEKYRNLPYIGVLRPELYAGPAEPAPTAVDS
ncbi:MAG: hypoxanthine phosphoribosyltransferase [Chloroflexi bacterium]|nr:hypoxanthine phosphoribosyltransferase [Chloroflexota bacterium]